VADGCRPCAVLSTGERLDPSRLVLLGGRPIGCGSLRRAAAEQCGHVAGLVRQQREAVTGVGPIALGNFSDPIEKHFKSQGKRLADHVFRADGAAGNVVKRVAVRLNHAETGGLQAGVDAENSHS